MTISMNKSLAVLVTTRRQFFRTCDGPGIVKKVDDMFHHGGITANRHNRQTVTRNELAALRKPFRLHQAFGAVVIETHKQASDFKEP
jgi:hypothetical protein